jgi:DNA replication protein DnaC
MNKLNTNLTDKLKHLKLSGMANCIDIRLQEAASNQMAHQEFFELLIQDECLSREQRRYEARYKKACFKGHKTIETYDFKFNPTLNQSLIRDLATCRFIREKNPVIIVGPCGTGKSHIAQAIGHCALQQGFTVLCTTQSKLSDELQTAKAVNGYSRKIQALRKINLLIIDDFGLKPLRSPEDENLHELIAERYEEASTLITSNLVLDEWQQAFNNQLLGVATIDRLRHNAYQLSLEGKSYRAVKTKN